MALLYMAAGVVHFIRPDFYLGIMPGWLPRPTALVLISGIAEFLLGVLLLLPATRRFSAWLIIAMLLVFLLLIHVPMLIDYSARNHPYLWLAILRIPIQFVLIRWAWAYTGKSYLYPPHTT